MPMPRLTSIPERSSRAMRLAMMVCASMASPIGDEKVNDRGRGNDMIGGNHSHRDDVICSYDDSVRCHRNHGIEVARGQCVGKIASIIGEKRVHEREIGA